MNTTPDDITFAYQSKLVEAWRNGEHENRDLTFLEEARIEAWIAPSHQIPARNSHGNG